MTEYSIWYRTVIWSAEITEVRVTRESGDFIYIIDEEYDGKARRHKKHEANTDYYKFHFEAVAGLVNKLTRRKQRAEVQMADAQRQMIKYESRLQVFQQRQGLVEATRRVCNACKHLVFEGEAFHECPSAEYLVKRDALLADACEAEERYGIEALDGGDQ